MQCQEHKKFNKTKKQIEKWFFNDKILQVQNKKNCSMIKYEMRAF